MPQKKGAKRSLPAELAAREPSRKQPEKRHKKQQPQPQPPPQPPPQHQQQQRPPRRPRGPQEGGERTAAASSSCSSSASASSSSSSSSSSSAAAVAAAAAAAEPPQPDARHIRKASLRSGGDDRPAEIQVPWLPSSREPAFDAALRAVTSRLTKQTKVTVVRTSTNQIELGSVPFASGDRSLITGANTQLAAAARGSNLPETRLYLFKKYAREFSGADLVLLFTEYTYADEAYEEVGKAGAPAGAPEAPRPPEVDVAVVEVDGEFAIPAGASLEGISGYYRVSVVARAGRIALPPSACSTILTVLSQTPHTAKLLDTGTRRRESKIKSGTKSSSRVSSQLQRLLEELAAAPAAVPRPAVDDFRGPAPKIGEFAEPTGTNEDEDDDDDMTEDDEPMHCGGGLAIPVAASLPSPPPRPIAPARVVAALARKRELMRADEKERERRIVEDFAAAAQHFRAKQLSILREHERTAVAQAAEAPAGGRRAEVDPKGERRFPQPALPATGAETGGKKFARKKRERRAKHCPAKSRDLAEKNASRARRVEPAECAAPGADRAANVPSAAPPDLPACFGPRAEPPFVPSTDLPEQASNSAFPPLGRLSAVFLPNPSIQSTTQPEPGSREYVLFSRADYIARHAVSAPVSSGTTPMCSPPPPLTSAPYAGGLWPPASPAATAAYPAAPLPVSAPFAFQPLQLCEERARTAGGMPPLLPPFARPAWYAADGAADAPTKPPPYAAAFSGMSAQPVPPPQQPPGSASLDPPGGMACGRSVPRFLDGYGSMSFKLAFGGCPNEPAGDASLAGRAAQRPLGAGRCEAQFGEAAGCGESMALWLPLTASQQQRWP